MLAAQLYGTEDLRIEETTEPTPGPGQVKLKNAYTGICGSDLHAYFMPGLSVETAPPHPLTNAALPQILGHEFSGTVAEVGAGVTTLVPGDRVTVWPVYHCGECASCHQGRPNACRVIGFHGLNSHGGGMSEYTVVDAVKVHKLPDSVSLRDGALVEPMAVAWHAVDRSGVESSSAALIVGGGPIGIGLLFALRARGIDRVIVSEPSEPRRAALVALGAPVIDPTTQDLAAAIAELTAGAGGDVAFEAAGVGPALEAALAALAPGGRAIVVSIHEKPVELSPNTLVLSESEIAGTLAYLPADFDAVIEAMSKGLYDTRGWVDEISLDEVPQALLRLREGKAAKFLVRIAAE